MTLPLNGKPRGVVQIPDDRPNDIHVKDLGSSCIEKLQTSHSGGGSQAIIHAKDDTRALICCDDD